MAKLPQVYSASTRMSTGGSPAQAQPIQIGRPSALQVAALRANKIQAPLYSTPVKEGYDATFKAIQQFGEVLVDVAASVADRKARLGADEKANAAWEATQALKSEFMSLTGKKAVDAYQGFAAGINKIEKDSLDAASPHEKIYLTKALRNLKNQTLDTASTHNATQTIVAMQNSTQTKLRNFGEDLKDWIYRKPEDAVNHINNYFNDPASGLFFSNDEERLQTRDEMLNQLVRIQADQVVMRGDGASATKVLGRLDSLRQRVNAYGKYVSLNQYSKFIGILETAQNRVATELDRLEVEQKEKRQKVHLAKENQVYKNLRDGDPVPTDLLNNTIAIGVFTQKEVNGIEKLFNNRDTVSGTGSVKRSTAQLMNRLDIEEMISRGEDYYEVMAAIKRSIGVNGLWGADVNSLVVTARNAQDTAYQDAFRRLMKIGEELIITTGFGAVYKNTAETPKLADYRERVTKRLNEMKASNTFTHENVEKYVNEERNRIHYDKTQEELPTLSTRDPNLQYPANIDQLNAAIEDIENNPNLDPGDVANQKIAATKWRKYFLIEQKRKENPK